MIIFLLAAVLLSQGLLFFLVLVALHKLESIQVNDEDASKWMQDILTLQSDWNKNVGKGNLAVAEVLTLLHERLNTLESESNNKDLH